MADNKQTPTTEEHIPPEAAGPEIPGAAPGDVVVDIGTIDELMKKRQAAARDAVEQTAEEQPPDLPAPGEEDTREPWEKTQDELNAENKKPRRGRPPKEAAEQTGPEGEKKPEEKAPRKGRPPKTNKTAPDKAEKPVRDKVSQSKKAPGKGVPDKVTAPAPEPVPPPDPANIPRPVEQGQIVYLKLAQLHAFHTFREHPYKVQDDDMMRELVGTIQEHGSQLAGAGIGIAG